MEDKMRKIIDIDLKTKLRSHPKRDMDKLYDQVVQELVQQQSKRDQLITIYLAAFAFIVPALLTAQEINWVVSGWIFVGLGVIGYLFGLIIVRYRKYKEVYWICCRTISVMTTLDETEWTKDNIAAIFYQCMRKKVKKYIKEDKKKTKGKDADQEMESFRTVRFVRDNFFSGETLYLVIQAIIAGSVLGLGISMLLPVVGWIKVTVGLICGALLFCALLWKYFSTLVKVYRVCVDKLKSSFNKTFGDAWFLHFFLD